MPFYWLLMFQLLSLLFCVRPIVKLYFLSSKSVDQVIFLYTPVRDRVVLWLNIALSMVVTPEQAVSTGLEQLKKQKPGLSDGTDWDGSCLIDNALNQFPK